MTVDPLKASKIRSRKPISNQSNSFKRNFQEYMVNSTFHGLNYVGDTKLSVAERCSLFDELKEKEIFATFHHIPFRLFFVLAFLLVSALSTYYISIMWMKWTATPVIVSNAPTTTSISEIPFPATTICNMNQAKKSIAKDITPGSVDGLQLKTLCMRTDDAKESDNFTSSWDLYKRFLLRVIKIHIVSSRM